MTEPSADEKLIEEARAFLDDDSDDECIINRSDDFVRRLSDALERAHRRNDRHVAATQDLGKAIEELQVERDEALRACADERERCAKVVEAAAEAQSVLAELRDSASANFIFYRMRRLEPAYQELSAALNALPLPALAGKQEMESEAGK